MRKAIGFPILAVLLGLSMFVLLAGDLHGRAATDNVCSVEGATATVARIGSSLPGDSVGSRVEVVLDHPAGT